MYSMSGNLPGECFEMASTVGSQAELLKAWRRKDLNAFNQALSEEGCNANHFYEEEYTYILDLVAGEPEGSPSTIEFAKALEKADSNINIVNVVRSNKTPLHFAAESGNFEIFQFLIERGADINARDSSDSTALHILVKQKWGVNFEKCLDFLLRQENLELNRTNKRGQTAAHLAGYEALKLLLDQGSKLDLDSAVVLNKSARTQIVGKYPDLESELPPPWTKDMFCKVKMDVDKLSMLLDSREEDRFCDSFKKEMKDKAQKDLLTETKGNLTLLQYCCFHNLIVAAKCILENETADVNYSPNAVLSERPVMIACRQGHHKILKILLQHKADLSPDENGENVLHVVSKRLDMSKGYQECLKILLEEVTENSLNLDINAQDVKGNTPLHYAVKYGGRDSVNVLLSGGAYIGTLNLFHDMPLAFMKSSTLEEFLDSSITSEGLMQNEFYALKFNYNFLVPTKKRRTWTNEVKIPMSQGDEGAVDSPREKIDHSPECDPLLYMSRTPDLRHLLTHPVFTSFIQLKWQRIRRFYYINLLFYFLFVLLLTIYVLFGYRHYALVERNHGVDNATEPTFARGEQKIAHDKDIGVLPEKVNFLTLPNDQNRSGSPVLQDTAVFFEKKFVDSDAVHLVRIVLVAFLILLALREAFQVFIHPIKYLTDPENWLEVALLIVASLVVVKDCSRQFKGSPNMNFLCPQFCAVAILLSWFELVLLVGKHPLQSLHIEMFKTVSINFLKFLAWYVILILAFALSFYTLFRNCSDDSCESNPFTNPGVSVFKTIVMLTGEFEAGDIPFISFVGTSHLIFTAFVFLIAIVLLNLLNGLAVADTQTIRDDAILYSTISLVKVVSYIENMLLGDATLIKLPLQKLQRCCTWLCSRGNEDEPDDICCFRFFADRIVFFPNLLREQAIFVYPNKNYKISFNSQDLKNFGSSTNLSRQLCFTKLSELRLDTTCAKLAENIVLRRELDSLEDGEKTEKEDIKLKETVNKINELEKKLESLEQSTKQNEKLLIQILAILSLNNANIDER